MLRRTIDRTPVPLQAAVNWIRHGDFSGSGKSLQGGPEKSEALAREDLLIALRDRDLCAVGRYSDSRAMCWERHLYGRDWIMHSARYSSIPAESWRSGHVDWKSFSLDPPGGQYIDIHIPRHLILGIWSPEKPPPEGAIIYRSPYMDLMLRAVDELELSESNQPIKRNLTEWFRAQQVGGREIPGYLAEAMATLVRLPESQRGGNRKWTGGAGREKPPSPSDQPSPS